MAKPKKATLPVLRDIQKVAAKYGYKLDAGSFSSIIAPDKPGETKAHIGFDAAAAPATEKMEVSTIQLVLKQENKIGSNIHWMKEN
jgi:hypothetical protein